MELNNILVSDSQLESLKKNKTIEFTEDLEFFDKYINQVKKIKDIKGNFKIE